MTVIYPAGLTENCLAKKGPSIHGPTLLDRFAAMLSFIMLFNIMPLFFLHQGHGPDFRFFEYRPHREFVH